MNASAHIWFDSVHTHLINVYGNVSICLYNVFYTEKHIRNVIKWNNELNVPNAVFVWWEAL